MLRRAQAFIELNLGKRFSLSELATWVGVSRFHFARLFRASTGHSPMQYVVSKRVERGKMLLVRDEYSISRVATLLGFSYQSHFTRTFRRLAGCTPSELVQRARAGSDASVITASPSNRPAPCCSSRWVCKGD